MKIIQQDLRTLGKEKQLHSGCAIWQLAYLSCLSGIQGQPGLHHLQKQQMKESNVEIVTLGDEKGTRTFETHTRTQRLTTDSSSNAWHLLLTNRIDLVKMIHEISLSQVYRDLLQGDREG